MLVASTHNACTRQYDSSTFNLNFGNKCLTPCKISGENPGLVDNDVVFRMLEVLKYTYVRDTPVFVMYCVYGVPRSSLLRESTDSMKNCPCGIITFMHGYVHTCTHTHTHAQTHTHTHTDGGLHR